MLISCQMWPDNTMEYELSVTRKKALTRATLQRILKTQRSWPQRTILSDSIFITV